jgi:hypothetical protein
VTTDIKDVAKLARQLSDMGCAVVVFTPEELRGASPKRVEDRLIERGWDVIDLLADPTDGEVAS